MLLTPLRSSPLKLLLQGSGLAFHSRQLDRADMPLKLLQRCLVGRIRCGAVQTLLIACVLLLVVAHVATILLHQSNPLLERLKLRSSLLWQQRGERRRRNGCRGTRTCRRGLAWYVGTTGAEEQ